MRSSLMLALLIGGCAFSPKESEDLVIGDLDKYDCVMEKTTERVERWTDVRQVCDTDFFQDDDLDDVEIPFSDEGSGDEPNCYFVVDRYTRQRQVVPTNWDCPGEKEPKFK